MNYLAHAYLSFQDEEILLGNMISDFVKGSSKFSFSKAIQNGIALHRQIDTYTDAHSIIKLCKKVYHPVYRLYSGAFVDVTMDHFLAKKLSLEIDFMAFTQNVYSQLEPFESIFPLRFKKMFPSMKEHNWLFNYQYKWGIEKSFTGLANRAQYINDPAPASILFENNYLFLEQQFSLFWKDLYQYSFEQYTLYKN